MTPDNTLPAFEVEEYAPPAPAAPAHVELVEQLIKLGASKVAKFVFATEDEALAALKSWQAAARYLNVSVKRHSLDVEGKGKDAKVALRVRVGERVTRVRGAKDAETVETLAE